MAFVTFDPENGDLALQLPEAYRRFQDQLYAQLAETFMDKALNDAVLDQMNRFVGEWLRRHAG